MSTMLDEFIHDNSLYFWTICGEHTWGRHESGRLLNMNDFSEIFE